jgi:DNA-directed RNA polymerase II subunit RPB2
MALQAVFKLLGVETQAAMADHIATASDPAWFRRRVEEVLVNDLEAALLQADVVMKRMAHDRGQSRRAAQAIRQQRQQAVAQATAAKASSKAAAAAATTTTPTPPTMPAPSTPILSPPTRGGLEEFSAEAEAILTRSRDPMVQEAEQAHAEAEVEREDAEVMVAAAEAAHAEAMEAAQAAFYAAMGNTNDAIPAMEAHVVTHTAATKAALLAARETLASAVQAVAAAAERARVAGVDAETAASRRQVMGLLRTEFLPHQGLEEDDNAGKAVAFGLSVRRLLGVYYSLDGMDVDSRDHYMHRRQEGIDSMLTPIFRSHLQAWRHRLAVQMCRALKEGNSFIDICRILPANIGAQLESAFKSGNFSINRGMSTLDSVSQTLSHIEPHSDLAHARRTDVPMPRDGRSTKPRMLNLSAGGATGPSETPEGQGCGLLRNLALLSGVRVGYDTRLLERAVVSTGLVEPVGAGPAAAGCVPVGRMTSAPVFVNGRLVGQARHSPDTVADRDPATHLLHTLRCLRATQDLPCDVSLYRTYGGGAVTPHGEVHINGDAGSYWWALLVVRRLSRLRQLLDSVTHDDGLWQLLLAEGLVELINKDEEVFCTRVAMSMRDLRMAPPDTYTHVVIHPSQVLSLTTSRIPLPEFNAAPRVTYAASMIKQALGQAPSNAAYRFDPSSYSLWYPQRPLLATVVSEHLRKGADSGQMAWVGIGSWDGFNIEDSLILNKSSAERGLFRNTNSRSVRDEVKSHGDEKETLGLPPADCRSRLSMDYSHINPATGLVEPGAILTRDSVVISKYVTSRSRRNVVDPVTGESRVVEETRVRDRSTHVRVREPVRVEEVLTTTTVDGNTLVRVRYCAMRQPKEGDKHASRYGQKGVVGRVVAATDMPYDERTGLTPDIMINPHGQPSRMTVGHLLEVLLGHVAAASGEFADGTPFTLSDAFDDGGADPEAVVRDVRRQMEALGFHRTDGKTRMRDGRTGRILKFDMYCGPQYYLALRHQVDDKIHSRSRGPVQMQTKQPVEGRHRDGGNRYGEMERDNSLAHGAPFFLMDRLVHCSDGDDIAVCEQCGTMAQPPKPTTAGGSLYGATVHASQPFCHVCLTGDHVVNRVMPHAFALSIHQCAALHIGVKLRGEAALRHETEHGVDL